LRMKLKKTIKKIMALGIGATMVGATLLGATALDLGNYPAPFVSDGTFSGALVIGDKAAAEDVIGVSAIASSLQYAASGGSSSSSAKTTVVGEAFTIRSGSNVLNFGESISDIKSTIDSGELPKLLANGKVRNKQGKSSDYTQKIKFINTAHTLTHIYDSDYDSKAPGVGIRVAKSATVLNYTIDFSPNLESSVDASNLWTDLEDRKMTILGTEYDITKIQNSSSTLTDITLMKGAIKDTLTEGETKTYTINDVPYEVTVSLITDMTSNNKVKFVINGETTDALLEDETYKLSDDSQIGVREILPNEAGDVTQDMVTFYLGASKIVLDDQSLIEMDDEDVDNVYAYVTETSGDPAKISKITIEWIADEDLFIAEDSTITLPGIGAISMGMSKFDLGVEEQIQVKPDGEDKVEMIVPLARCDATFDILYDSNDNGNNWTYLGEDVDQQLVICNTQCVVNETDQWVIVSDSTSGGETSEMFKVTKVSDKNGITIKDICGNTVISDWTMSDNNCAAPGAGDTFDIGDLTVNVVCYNESANGGTYVDEVNLTVSGGTTYLYSKEGMRIQLPTAAASATSYDIKFTVEDVNENIGAGSSFNLTAASNQGSNLEASVSLKSPSSASTCVNDLRETGSNTDIYECYINNATSAKVVEDRTTTNSKAITITYAGEESYADVYVSAEGTVVTAGTSSKGTTVAGKIDVSATKLASEISDVTTQNLILVGGPCANRAAADVMDNPSDCVKGFEAGKGIIQLFSDTGSGKVAILVAGMNAEDTRAAAMVMAEYDKYATDLKGKTKVEVSTATSTVTEVTETVEEPVAEEPVAEPTPVE